MNRARNPQTGGYRSPRPPTSWVPSGAPHLQQPSYGYMQPGSYPGAAPQYNMSQPPYVGYPPPPPPPAQQTTQTTGYDYYNHQQQPQPPPPPPPVGGSSAPSDGNNYIYNQMPASYNGQPPYGESTYSQSAVVYPQSYGQPADYNQTTAQAGFSQPISNPLTGYTQQSYSSAPSYGNTAPTQEGANTNTNYGVESSTQQPPITAAQPGYIATPTSQSVYASQPSVQANYSQSTPSAPPSLAQKPQPSQAGYTQPYGSGYAQDSQQLALQAGYALQQSYGGAPLIQTSYSQPQTQLYGDSYSSGAYSQPPYSTDGTPAAASAEAASSTGLTKASHQS